MNLSRFACQPILFPYTASAGAGPLQISLDDGATWLETQVSDKGPTVLLAGPDWVAGDGDDTPAAVLALGEHKVFGRVEYSDAPAVPDSAVDSIWVN